MGQETIVPSAGLTDAESDLIFKALSSHQRREILRMLAECTPAPGKSCCADDEVCACKITGRLGLAPSTVSHHMALLQEAGLVDARKQGTWVYYTLRRDVLSKAAAELKSL